MPGRLIICVFLIIAGIFAYAPVLAEEITPLSDKIPSKWSEEENQAFASMVNGFSLYNRLLNDISKERDGYRLTEHGANEEEIINYLDAGFEPELAAGIIEAYLQWVPELHGMAVIPCDGIPTLGKADRYELVCSKVGDSTILFQRYYKDCYSQGDSYRFSVTVHKSVKGWRIQEINLDECN